MIKHDYEEALKYFQQAAWVAPDNARYVGNLAMAQGMMGRYDESLKTYQRVMMPAKAHYNLGVICEARQDYERATQEYATAQRMNPHIRAPRRAIGPMHAAQEDTDDSQRKTQTEEPDEAESIGSVPGWERYR